jgi:hypothetical protein
LKEKEKGEEKISGNSKRSWNEWFFTGYGNSVSLGSVKIFQK